jgi:hypothetical protein
VALTYYDNPNIAQRQIPIAKKSRHYMNAEKNRRIYAPVADDHATSAMRASGNAREAYGYFLLPITYYLFSMTFFLPHVFTQQQDWEYWPRVTT